MRTVDGRDRRRVLFPDVAQKIAQPVRSERAQTGRNRRFMLQPPCKMLKGDAPVIDALRAPALGVPVAEPVLRRAAQVVSGLP